MLWIAGKINMKYENDTHDEIERRFLVEQIPDLKDVPKKEIVQGYIDLHEEGYLGARIRKSDNEFFLTIKEGEGLVRREMEKPIGTVIFGGFGFQPTTGRLPKRDIIFQTSILFLSWICITKNMKVL